jgi:phage tail-like protein
VLVLDPAGAADRAATAAYAPLDAGATLALAQAGATTWAAGAHGAGALAGGALERRDEPAAAGVAIACDGRVLFATPTAIVTLVPGATAIHGTIVVPAPPGLLPWDRVRVVLAEPLARETHVRVWTRADAAAPAPPAPVAGDEPEAPLPTPAQTWRAAPLDVLDVRPLVAAAQALWIAVELHGDGSASPVVDDVRVDRTGRGWLADLPHALVDADEDPLTRVLALLASVYEDVAGAIDALPGRLDPAIAPDRRDAPWVARLARWVDVEPAARLDEAQRRALVRDAVALHERRGTVRGIVDAVRRDVGVEVTIVEPAPAPAWTLGQGGGALAGGAALGAAPAGPPVLDTTAIVDRSWLVDDGERGLALLAGSAHRFCVLAPADALRDPGSRAAIERVVEREKPSHTVFELGTPETASASGASRVGIDRLVDRADAALRLDGADRLGSGTVLMGQQATDKPAPGRVGKTTVVGASHPERTRP